MKVAIVGAGTRGDMQPIAALAQRLARAGHAVRFIAHPSWRHLTAGKAPIEFVPRDSVDPRVVLDANLRSRPRTLLGKIARLAVASHSYNDKGDVADACRGSEFLLFSQMYWPVAHIAEYLDVPCAVACALPLFPTGEFPRAAGSAWFHRHALGPYWNRFTHTLFQRANRSRDIPWLNVWRRELGLQPIRDQEDWAEQRRIPRLYGYSAQLLPRPRDWPPWHQVTGYWFWEDEAWRPPDALEAFLDSATPTAFIGFSSSILTDSSLIERVLLPAVRRAGLRAVVATGWTHSGVQAAPDVYVLDSCPFDWLFPRVSLIVHAAGAGTVGEVLRSGKPSVCIPQFSDQRFWAARLEGLGVAPPQLTPGRLSITAGANAVSAAMQKDVRDRAALLSRGLSAEDGPARALEVLEGAGLLRA